MTGVPNLQLPPPKSELRIKAEEFIQNMFRRRRHYCPEVIDYLESGPIADVVMLLLVECFIHGYAHGIDSAYEVIQDEFSHPTSPTPEDPTPNA